MCNDRRFLRRTVFGMALWSNAIQHLAKPSNILRRKQHRTGFGPAPQRSHQRPVRIGPEHLGTLDMAPYARLFSAHGICYGFGGNMDGDIMGFFARKFYNALVGAVARRTDRGMATPLHRDTRWIRTSCLISVVLAIPASAYAETIRLATWNAGLSRNGPGVLLRDLQKSDDPQIAAVVQVLARMKPDVLLLTGVDWDYEARALNTLRAILAEAGVDYSHAYAPQPNTGMPTGVDIDGNGRTNDPRDEIGRAHV